MGRGWVKSCKVKKPERGKGWECSGRSKISDNARLRAAVALRAEFNEGRAVHGARCGGFGGGVVFIWRFVLPGPFLGTADGGADFWLAHAGDAALDHAAAALQRAGARCAGHCPAGAPPLAT